MKILVVSINQFFMLYVKCGVPQRYVVGSILFSIYYFLFIILTFQMTFANDAQF